MLSEAYDIFRSLDRMGIDIPANHRDVKKPGKKPGYWVGLGPDGFAQEVEERTPDMIGKLWYHREGKKNAFPVVKIQHALLSLPVDDPIRAKLKALNREEKQKRVGLLREALDNREIQLPDKDAQTWNRLRIKACDWLALFNQEDDRYRALTLMLCRIAESGKSPTDFLRNLCHLIVQRLEQGRLTDVALAEKLLVGTPDERRPKQPAKAEVPVALDIAENDNPVSIYEPKMESHVIRCLRESEIRDPDGVCAYQRIEKQLLKRRFPEPQLGALGEVKLFTKNKDTPCEFRYLKRSEDWQDASKSFPVDQSLADDIAAGVSILTSANLKGKTWRMVANGKWEGSGRNKKEKRDLLLVYCEEQPILSEEVTDTFGNDEGEIQHQFENDAQALCRALEGIIKHHPRSRLNLVLIGKADKEKKQVMMHITPTLQEVMEAAEQWQRAVKNNLPPIAVPFPPEEKGQEPILVQPVPPHPDRVVRLLSSEWVRGGTDELKLEGPALRQVLDLMLRSTGRWEEEANNLLYLTIERIGPLLIGLAAALHSGEKERIKKITTPQREAALRAVALLGILLDALGRRKEVYMGDTAFQLGRLLSLADMLHKEYCEHVRKGEIPPQLIGNALMPAAADNPEDALDRLRERMLIYYAWATKVSGETYRRAKWSVGQMGEISNNIKRPLPTQTDQTFRAELVLGYLARPPKENE